MNDRKIITIGILGATAVFFGALGAHFLKGKLASGLITTDQLAGFDTAVKYQMYHVLAMLLMILVLKQSENKFIKWAYNFFLVGIILFSGSLYFLCTRNLLGMEALKVLGPITPVGGLFFVAGWTSIIFAGIKKHNTKNKL